MDYIFLQQYWWFIISLLASLLVFLFFVQGGQSLIGTIARTDEQRTLLVNSLGRKWEFTFTTLVTFGGAFFASFPLFYSTSFGGAFYVWMAILFVMVIQAVSYEFRSKAGNLLGQKTYDVFLMINGVLAPLLVGVAVGTFFNGANFTVDFANIGILTAGENIISQWDSPWRGLEAVGDFSNVLLGVAVLFLARSLGLLYFINNIEDAAVVGRSRKVLWVEAGVAVVALVGFLGTILDRLMVDYVYVAILLVGVVLVLFGLYRALIAMGRNGIWFAGAGVVVAVMALLLCVGYTGAYYPSLSDQESSLTIYNSSSSEFTLRVMFYVSLGVPVVAGYIVYVWRAMNKKQMSTDDLNREDHAY